ncbi:MAG: hypothetical protein R3Y57_00130 [Erysipelotrichaceae bacterium]
MKISEIIKDTDWKVYGEALEQEVEGVFVSDLLSWVIGHGEENQAWVTMQTHLNVLAVAALKEFSCIIVTHDAPISEEVQKEAIEKNIMMLQTSLTSYEACKYLVSKGL